MNPTGKLSSGAASRSGPALLCLYPAMNRSKELALAGFRNCACSWVWIGPIHNPDPHDLTMKDHSLGESNSQLLPKVQKVSRSCMVLPRTSTSLSSSRPTPPDGLLPLRPTSVGRWRAWCSGVAGARPHRSQTAGARPHGRWLGLFPANQLDVQKTEMDV